MNAERIKRLSMSFFILNVLMMVSLPFVFQKGMFLDGITYATISRNLSMGIGQFWAPHYTQTLSPIFYGHPPLTFGLQSILFSVLGDHYYVERIYSICTFVMTGLGILLIWRVHYREELLYSKFWWVPLLIWVSLPLTGWAYSNNILENTVSVFCVFAVLSSYLGLLRSSYLHTVFGSLFIVFAFMSKGPIGLFPVITPIAYYLANNAELKNVIYHFFMLLFGILILFIAIINSSSLSYPFLMSYYEIQILPAIINSGELTTTNRFSILFKLITELLIPLSLIGSLLSIFYYKNKLSPFTKFCRKDLFFILIALSASIPLICTFKQRRFYLLPSLPFFAISLSCFILPMLRYYYDLVSLRTFRRIFIFSFIVSLCVVAYTLKNIGRINRDLNYIETTSILLNHIDRGSTFTTYDSLCNDWKLIAYLSRIGRYSLECDTEQDYLITRNDFTLSCEHEEKGFVFLLVLEGFNLYSRREIR